jgi:hypothetical protein
MPTRDAGEHAGRAPTTTPSFHSLVYGTGDIFELSRVTLTRPPSPVEIRALVLLHEVAHRIGSSPFANGVHTHAAQDPSGKVFNTGLLVKRLGAARFK